MKLLAFFTLLLGTFGALSAHADLMPDDEISLDQIRAFRAIPITVENGRTVQCKIVNGRLVPLEPGEKPQAVLITPRDGSLKIQKKPTFASDPWAYDFIIGNTRYQTAKANLPDSLLAASKRCGSAPLTLKTNSVATTRLVRAIADKAREEDLSPPTAGSCEDYEKTSGSFQVRRSSPRGTCYVDISTGIDSLNAMKQFSFTNDGGLQIQQQVCDSGYRNTFCLGVQQLYFLPRKHRYQGLKAAGNSASVQTQSGTTISISSDGRILSSNPTLKSTFPNPWFKSQRPTTTPVPTLVHVQKAAKGELIIDCGTAGGGSPQAKPGRNSTIIDSAGHTCSINNSLLFKKKGYDALFSGTDASLYALFRQHCPGLIVP